uniref:methyl-accepting chemotaxis protein n=1 Tax=Faecalimicrobium dakarense TaxID=1301100 RepID=UPI0005A9D9CB
MKNLKIGKKLFLAFGILLMLTIFSSFYTISKLKQSEKLSQQLFTGPYVTTTESMGIRRDLVAVGRYLGNAIMEKNLTLYKAKMVAEFDSISQRLKNIREAFSGDPKFVDNLEQSVNALKQECDKVLALIEQGNYEKAVEITEPNTPYFNAYDKCVDDAVSFNQEVEADAIKFNKGVSETSKRATFASIAISAFTVVSGVAICIFITKRLKQPIEEIEIAADKMADGDFDITINYESKDELGSLANSMRKMSNTTKEIINDTVRGLGEVASGNFDIEPEVEFIGIFKEIENSINKITHDLSETMSQINVAAEEVGAASDQVAGGSQMLSQGATEQASAIQELSATIIEISDKIKDTADNARKANSLTLSSARQVKDGNEQMKQMVKAMEEISFTSNEIGR